MDVKQMYNVAHRVGTHGIEGYDVANRYEDYNANKKRINRSVTTTNIKNSDRNSYMAELEKASKHVPGPGAYKLKEEFDVATKVKTSRSTTSHKMTYVDEIIARAKREKTPAPGQYTHEQIHKQFNKKRVLGDNITKINYLDEVQYEASQVPGPGAYNPHDVKHKIPPDRRDPTYWIKKALAQQKKKPAKMPDVGSYHPQSSSYHLFGDYQDKINKSKSGFSRDTRFAQDRAKKSKQANPPGPGQYPIQTRWRGKSDPKNPTNILDKISHPPSRSIYY